MRYSAIATAYYFITCYLSAYSLSNCSFYTISSFICVQSIVLQ